MRSSLQKDLAVYDFNEEEEAVEAASGKYAARIQSGLREPETKYQFPEAARIQSGLKEAETKYQFLEACMPFPTRNP